MSKKNIAAIMTVVFSFMLPLLKADAGEYVIDGDFTVNSNAVLNNIINVGMIQFSNYPSYYPGIILSSFYDGLYVNGEKVVVGDILNTANYSLNLTRTQPGSEFDCLGGLTLQSTHHNLDTMTTNYSVAIESTSDVKNEIRVTGHFNMQGSAISNGVFVGDGSGLTNIQLSSITETDPVWQAEKGQYATGTPLYVESVGEWGGTIRSASLSSSHAIIWNGASSGTVTQRVVDGVMALNEQLIVTEEDLDQYVLKTGANSPESIGINGLLAVTNSSYPNAYIRMKIEGGGPDRAGTIYLQNASGSYSMIRQQSSGHLLVNTVNGMKLGSGCYYGDGSGLTIQPQGDLSMGSFTNRPVQ